ncbi:hypothetical protein [Mucilaginibacter lacusdianchii]|uniref:hypothetical protein n=1 Tax=Mucilaginibacter lacusdianchii TaxID=2684211 RepID=UPI00131B89EB|nr:hypothetical protein [Mucilaginibacter sp. JXJ CY 39]
MLYFNLYPDYEILSKYVRFNQTFEQLVNEADQGYPIVVDYFDTDDKIDRVQKTFRKLLVDNKLEAHYDNLLLLSLILINQHQSFITAANDYYQIQIAKKEIRKFLSTCNKNGIALSVKKPNGKSDKINNKPVIEWIGKLIQEAIDNNNMPRSISGHLGFSAIPNYIFNINAPTLDSFIKQNDTRFISEFCITVCTYLNSETTLQSSINGDFDHAQLTFVYHLMVMLNLLKDKVFQLGSTVEHYDYQPHKYIRSTLNQYKKKLKLDGKKLKNPN